MDLTVDLAIYKKCQIAIKLLLAYFNGFYKICSSSSKSVAILRLVFKYFFFLNSFFKELNNKNRIYYSFANLLHRSYWFKLFLFLTYYYY